MKVKVSYTVEVTDEYRLAVNHHYGKPGKADRKEIQTHFYLYGASIDDDLLSEYRADMEEENEE